MSFVPYPISAFFCFLFVLVVLYFFFVALISRVAFLLLCSRTRYASTWFAYLDSLAFGFSLSHRDHRACKRFSRMKNQHGHWVCCGYRRSTGRKKRFIEEHKRGSTNIPDITHRTKQQTIVNQILYRIPSTAGILRIW